ncbi:hypothetical protein HMJ29_12480 [Hymenobacter taeanensis]|uniref:Uncharacterized protein n=1 Tax=Hymenobacter taeanensis TaxID=2735321 RepID=A0A6M6BI98_9BACT|nr:MULTISPECIES: hypothetical protein [Hymenobacter]QJX47712.1 hypothetical protein HMJ29_12480 [Hymenobacter taeanensis]UOQ82803.1 hypothetical protein MUN83_08590 [Hymenobacter sp. 5414T-23]
MLRSFFTWFLLLSTAALVAACCGSVACDCNDANADSFALKFDTTTASTRPFKVADLDTVYVVRRVLADTAKRPVRDTVAIVRTLQQVRQQPIIINNTSPFVATNNRKVSQYSYKLYLVDSKKPKVPTDSVVVERVDLAGEFKADGCCTCYENTKRVLYIKGLATPFDATNPADPKQPVPFVVKR